MLATVSSSLLKGILPIVVWLPVVVWSQVRPPNFSPDLLPETAFTCEDKVTGGYYADVEAQCQLFHVCVQVSEYEFQDFHFLCPNDTVFDQQHLVCTNWFEVDCYAQIELVPLQFFSNDFGVRAEADHLAADKDEDVRIRSKSSSRHGFRNTGRGQLDVGKKNIDSFPSNDFLQDEQPFDGTPIPLGFTTTIRPPGGQPTSSSHRFLSGRNLVVPASSSLDNDQEEEDDVVPTPAPPPPPPAKFEKSRFAVDGRKPKVKSNLKAKLRNKKGGGNFANFGLDSTGRGQFNNGGTGAGRNQFKHRSKNFPTTTEEPFYGPDVKPDGREPRVKSDLRAEIPRGETTTLEPFIENFFASPSSPKPFIFRGSPAPSENRFGGSGKGRFNNFDNDRFGGDDLVGSATTVKSFFVPTPKPSFAGISQTPEILTLGLKSAEVTEPNTETNVFQEVEPVEEEEEEEVKPFVNLNKFHGRGRGGHPGRLGRRRTTTTTELPSHILIPFNDINEVQERLEAEAKVEDSGEPDNEVEDDSDDQLGLKCKDPFRCPQRGLGFAKNRRPRVKSNIRARKRNYWSQNGGFTKRPVFGKNGGVRTRKFRRGRKQRVPQQSANSLPGDSDAIKKGRRKKFESVEAEEDDFLPTVHTTIEDVTTPPPPAPEDKSSEEAEIFEELFESNNDLIVASSTVSSVVFKGTPTPGPFGFFSSPSPNFDSESGVFIGSPRPSFSNIGNHIDLGPKKFFNGNNVFVTSTQSNKIFIGSEQEKEEEKEAEKPATSTANTKIQFPSFPSRGKLGALSFPFRPKTNFGTVATSTLPEDGRTSAEIEVTPFTTATPVVSTTTTPQFEPTSSKFSPFASNFAKKRRFNSFFNRNRADIGGTTTEASTVQPVEDENEEPEAFTTDSPVTTTAASTTTTTQSVENNGNNNQRRFPFQFRQNLLGLKPFQSKSRGRTELVKETSAKSVDSQESADNEDATEVPPVALVTDLLEDSQEDNEIDDNEEDNAQPEIGRRFRGRPGKKQSGFKRFPGVKKARKAPPNANIRVEFAKANIPEEEASVEDSAPRKFFVRPDGRKPRVKSNIRARLANKGKIAFQESGETTGFRHSTKVDDIDFTGEEQNIDESEEFNLEKRHISSAELNSYTADTVHHQTREYPQYEEEGFQRQPTHSVFYPAAEEHNNNNNLIQEQISQLQQQPTPFTSSSAEQLQQTNPDNVPVPFLTLNPRPSHQHELLEKLVEESSSGSSGASSGETGSPSGATAPAFRVASSAASAVAAAPQQSTNLSAFKALLSQSREAAGGSSSGAGAGAVPADLAAFPLQLLNPRDVVQSQV